MINARSLIALVGACALAIACGGRSTVESVAAARQHLAANELPAAIIVLKAALQQEPDSAEARLLLGKALLDSEDPVGAAVELAKAAELGAPADQVVPQLARALLRTGQPKKVVDLDQASSLGAPEAVAELKTSVAIALGLMGESAKSEAVLADALRAQPTYPFAQLLRARRLAVAGDLAGAKALVDGVIEKSGGDSAAIADAFKLKGDLILASGGTAEAAAAEWRNALAADPRDVAAHGALIQQALMRSDLPGAATQWEALKAARPRHLQTLYFDARIKAQKGELKAADEQVQQLLKVAPENVEVLQLAGGISIQRGDLQRAEKHFGKLLQLEPNAAGPKLMLSRVYLRGGEPSKALAALRPLLAAASPSAEVLSLAGSASLAAGDTKLAEAYLSRAAKLKPDDPQNRTALAITRIARGDAETGLGQLEAIAGGDAGTAADYALINQYVAKRNWSGALKAVDRLVAKLPGKPTPLFLRGQVLAQKGDPAGARAAFEQAVAADSTYFAAVGALADLDVRERRTDAARARLETYLQANPKNSRAMLALAKLDELAGKPRDEVGARLSKAMTADPNDPLARERLVRFHLANQDTKAAHSAAQAAAAALPENDEILWLLAGTQVAAGELNQGIGSFTKLAAQRPKDLRPLLALVDAQLAAKSLAGADAAIAKALALAPDSVAVVQAAGKVDLAAGRKESALKRAQALQQKSPSSPQGWILEAEVRVSLGEWALAAAALRAALQKDPATQAPQRLHAAVLASDRPRADRFAAEWLERQPDDAAFRFHLAGIAIADKNYARAESELGQVLRITPDNAAALNNLAWVLATQGKPGAVDKARRANELAPNQPPFLDTLAMALAAAGRAEEAVEVQRKAVTLAPNAHILRLHLTQYLLQAGKKAEAKKELDTLTALGERFPAQSQVKELRERL